MGYGNPGDAGGAAHRIDSCTGLDYVPNRDIVVLKLTPDGSLEWAKVIDNGFDDAAEDLVELSVGGYAVAGQTSDSRSGPPRPVLIRLSPDGPVVWDRFVTDGLDVANAVVPAGDGGTAVLTGNGTVVRFDPAGRVLWARPSGVPEAQALLSTSNGGFLVGGRIMYQVSVNDTAGAPTVIAVPVRTTDSGQSNGGPVLAEAADPPATRTLLQVPRRFTLVRKAMVVRLAPDGAIAWERQYDDNGLMNVVSLAEGSAGTGFLLAGEGTLANNSYSNPLLVLHLDPEGTPGPLTPLGEPTSFSWSVQMRSDPGGYRVLYQPTRISQENYFNGAEDAVLDRDGRVLERRTIDASIAVTWTADRGYFSIGIPPGERGSFHARRFDDAGAIVWDRALPALPFDEVQKVVQTADGGYAVLGFRQNN